MGADGDAMTPVARSTDPWTSWAAAESLGDLRGRQAAVAAVFDACPDGLTLEELVHAYRNAGVPLPVQSDSGIRTRASELAALGLVVDTGTTRPTASGRNARVLRLVDAGGRPGRPWPRPLQMTLDDVDGGS